MLLSRGRFVPLALAAALLTPLVHNDDFLGTWDTDFGQLEVFGRANELIGTYPGGSVWGATVGDRWVVRYEDSAGRGDGSFQIEDGVLKGRWRKDGTQRYKPWNGTRVEEAVPDSLAGLWETSFGHMRLFAEPDGGVRGTYEGAEGNWLAGKERGNRLEFRYGDDSGQGQGWFELSADRLRFEGQWRPDGAAEWKEWSGARTRRSAGRLWLVVLEARWEEGLAEREYSFGSMLRSYFTMSLARHVEVRHRFFHDEADFLRLAHETTFLNGPVYLVVASHGTPDGIQVGSSVLPAETVASGLAHASNVEVLHLSGCDLMSGTVPQEILQGLPAGIHFPISGYAATVPWEASAISDFTYLSLVLIHRLAPARAIEETHELSPFTGEAAGGFFGELKLRIVD